MNPWIVPIDRPTRVLTTSSKTQFAQIPQSFPLVDVAVRDAAMKAFRSSAPGTHD